MSDSIEALRLKLQQLQDLRDRGDLDEAAYSRARQPLEQALVQQVMAGAASAPAAPATASTPATEAAPRAPLRLQALLAAGVVALAVAGYSYTGSPSQTVVDPSIAAAAAPEGAASGGLPGADGAPVTEAQVTEIVERLAARLKEKPDDAAGWALLARAYSALGRHAEAAPAYKRVLDLSGESADLLADYADAQAAAVGGRVDDAALALVNRALQLDPNHLKAQAMAGSAAFDRRDYATAVQRWEAVARALPPDSRFVAELQGSIAQARQLAGLPPAPMPSAPLAAAAAPPAGANPDANAGTPAPAAAAQAVSGEVRLAPALAARAAPTDTVFILARAAEGPRMPLAVLRKQVKDLPLSFTLDDSMAMTPEMKISSQARVVISARISKSGDAMPQAGDLSGQSAPVAPGAKGLTLTIDQVVGP